MKTHLIHFAVLFALIFLPGCQGCQRVSNFFCQGYLKCPDCNTAYKMVGGLPGQFNVTHCRACGGDKVREVSKAASGWSDEREREKGWEFEGDYQ